MYQPNNGMTPQAFARWLDTLPIGTPPPRPGSRAAAIQARRRGEKTIACQRHRPDCLFSHGFNGQPGYPCSSPAECRKLGKAWTNVLARS